MKGRVVYRQQSGLVQIRFEVVAHRGVPGLTPIAIMMLQLARRLLLTLLHLEELHCHVAQYLAETVEPIDRLRYAAEGL